MKSVRKWKRWWLHRYEEVLALLLFNRFSRLFVVVFVLIVRVHASTVIHAPLLHS